MATTTNAANKSDKHLKSNTDSVESSSDDDDLDIDDCVCLYIWREIIEEQNSMREFLMQTMTRRPTIAREVLRILETQNEEATRAITHQIQDICDKCKKMHCTISCKDDDGCNHGCDTRHHHDLE